MRTCAPHFLDPFIYRWALRLLLYLGYCDECCSEHRDIGVHISFQISVLVLFGKISRSGIAGLYGKVVIALVF